MTWIVSTLNDKWNKLYLKSKMLKDFRTDFGDYAEDIADIINLGAGNGDFSLSENSLLTSIREGFDNILSQGYSLMSADYFDIMKVLNLPTTDFEDLIEQLSDYMHGAGLYFLSRIIAYTVNDMAGTKIDLVRCDTDKRGYKMENVSPGKLTFKVIGDYNTGATRYGQEILKIIPDRRGFDFIESIDRTNLSIDVVTPIDSLSARSLSSTHQSFQGVGTESDVYPIALTDDNMGEWELLTGDWGCAECISTDYNWYDDVLSASFGRALKCHRYHDGVTNHNVFKIGIEPNFSLDSNLPYYFAVHIKNGLTTTNASVTMNLGSKSKTHNFVSGGGGGWVRFEFDRDENCWYDVFKPATATPVIVSLEMTFDAASDVASDLIYIDDVIFAEFDYVGNLPLFPVRGAVNPVKDDSCDITVSYTDTCLRQKVLAEHFDVYLPHGVAAGYISDNALIP